MKIFFVATLYQSAKYKPLSTRCERKGGRAIPTRYEPKRRFAGHHFPHVIDMDKTRLQTISQQLVFLSGRLDLQFTVHDSDDRSSAHIVMLAQRFEKWLLSFSGIQISCVCKHRQNKVW